MKDLFALLDAIHIPFNRPEYQPGGGLTHCNQFTAEVCATYGFRGLEGLLANDIIDLLSKHDQWSSVPLNQAQELANGGTLVLAGFKSDPHGHVAIVCPGKEKFSGRWGKVPSLASVGKENTIGKGCNWSFSDMPLFWAWRPSL